MRDACTGLHIVTEGMVKLYRSNASGREQTILLEGAGGVLAISPLFADGRYVTSAQAIRQTTTLFLTRDDFQDLYDRRPDFRDVVMAEMTRRFHMVVDLVDTLTLMSVPARVARRLLYLAAMSGALDGSRSFDLMLSQDEMAHILGTSRESVSRSLAELRSAGIIEHRGTNIRILDVDALSAWSRSVAQSFSEAFRLRGGDT